MDLPRTVLGLLPDDSIARFVRAVETAIIRTTPPGTSLTGWDVKYRTNRCIEILKVLRGDMKWPLQRALDHIPIYLGEELNGKAWEPSARKAWFASAEPGDPRWNSSPAEDVGTVESDIQPTRES